MYKVITSQFGGVTLPGRMITPSGMTWKSEQISCRVIPEEIEVPTEVHQLSERILAIKKPKENARTYHLRSANVSQESLALEVGKSWYRYNLLHAAFEDRLREEHPEVFEVLLHHVRPEDLFNLKALGGPLSSGVGITTVVVLAEGLTVMVHRSKGVSVNADMDHPALAEGVNPEAGVTGEIDLPKVAIRSGLEELGISTRQEDLVFLGLCADGRYWWPGLIARVEVSLTWNELRYRSESARDRWERSNIRFISYTPKGIAQELAFAMEPGRGVTGFGSMALLEAGIADFGREEMEAAFRSF
ncbi:MAG TPA: hypothetical protein VF303_03115 [Candidatus Nanoarchaeia archaeon]